MSKTNPRAIMHLYKDKEDLPPDLCALATAAFMGTTVSNCPFDYPEPVKRLGELVNVPVALGSNLDTSV